MTESTKRGKLCPSHGGPEMGVVVHWLCRSGEGGSRLSLKKETIRWGKKGREEVEFILLATFLVFFGRDPQGGKARNLLSRRRAKKGFNALNSGKLRGGGGGNVC